MLSVGQSTTNVPFFKSIPPERVGLSGEYDHQGLTKRVALAFHQNFAPEEIRSLRVTQRGAVVVLLGKITNQRLLIRLVNVAMSVNGAVDVEVNGISVADRLKTYLTIRPSSVSLKSFRSMLSE